MPTHSQTAPAVPSPEEARNRYYGLVSQPRFIARSSHEPWVLPSGMEAYIRPMELRPIGQHPFCDVWIAPLRARMAQFLSQEDVCWVSLDPVRFGAVGDTTARCILLLGVFPGSLSAERGINIAVGLREILLSTGTERLDEVHAEICESTIIASALMYQPVPKSDHTVEVKGPFSTALGFAICAEATPTIYSTATLFFTVHSKPGRLFLLATKHGLFDIDADNNHYEYGGTGSRRNVLLLGTQNFKNCLQHIEAKIRSAQVEMKQLLKRHDTVAKLDNPALARAELDDISADIRKLNETILQLEQFRDEILRDWADPRGRILGHVVLSPPLILHAGAEGFTQDFAVIEVYRTKIDRSNFVGNVIDLGTRITVGDFTAYMQPSPFSYPGDRLLRLQDPLPIDQILRSDPHPDTRGDSTTMVLMRGATSGISIGRLNNVCSMLRKPFRNLEGDYSEEVVILSRTNTFAPFSAAGDSGAAVVTGEGVVVGMLTGGAGDHRGCDRTYVSPMIFLLDRLRMYGYPANISFDDVDLFG